MRVYDPHETTTEVRGGDRRKGNFRVLLISIVAIVVLFALVFMFYHTTTTGNVIS
jgi:hypothetical protein